MDPNVQVAFVSVLVAMVTTSGVVAVAFINKTPKPITAQEIDGLDEKDVLERMLALITENERKEETIRALRLEKRGLEGEVRILKNENALLTNARRPNAGHD